MPGTPPRRRRSRFGLRRLAAAFESAGKPAQSKAFGIHRQRRAPRRFSGNAAIAKVTLDYPDVTFTDYMSLLKIGDEWKIVNKTFYADRKKK